MAQYPGAVKTFTVKSDGAGNKVFAAHINEIQDEVTAIEDGLLNGTAPVGASNASLHALTVSAGSTLATLSVTGGSTFVGSAVFSSVITAPAQPRFVGLSTATLAVSSASTVVISFIRELTDVGGFHSTASNPSRAVVPTGSSGWYACFGQTLVPSGAGLLYNLHLLVNGTPRVTTQGVTNSTHQTTAQVMGDFELNATDYVELAFGAFTGALTIGNASSLYGSRLRLKKDA